MSQQEFVTLRFAKTSLSWTKTVIFGRPLDDVDTDNNVRASSIAVAAFLYVRYKSRALGNLAPFSESP